MCVLACVCVCVCVHACVRACVYVCARVLLCVPASAIFTRLSHITHTPTYRLIQRLSSRAHPPRMARSIVTAVACVHPANSMLVATVCQRCHNITLAHCSPISLMQPVATIGNNNKQGPLATAKGRTHHSGWQASPLLLLPLTSSLPSSLPPSLLRSFTTTTTTTPISAVLILGTVGTVLVIWCAD